MVMTTDTPIKIQIVKSLSNLKPSRMIAVKADNESSFSLYVTDKVGVPYPLKDLQGSGGITTLINTDGNLVITGVNNKVINIAPALLSLINSALQSGDNISELVNDAGYITSVDLPTKTSELINDGSDATSTYVEADELGAVAFSNDYNDLDNLPTIPTVTSFADQTETNTGVVTDKTIAPNTLAGWWTYQKGLIQTFAQKITFTLGALFSPQVQPTHERGRIYFDDANDCISFMDSISGTSVQVGYEVLMRARNNTGVTIPNGSVVYISGAIGQNSTIAIAQANALPTSEIIGIATHDIANNTVGKICVFGLVNDLNTSSFTDGQMIYLSDSVAGGLTSTIPASPNFVVVLGVVEHAHPTQGKILVRPQRALANNNSLGTAQNVPPTQNAVKVITDSKLDKVTTNDVEKVYIKNANGTQGMKPMSELLSEILITNANVTGTYDIDYSAGNVWDLTLTGNTTLTESNAPASGTTKTITLEVSGNYTLIYPSSWTNGITGEYKGTATLNTITIQTFGSKRKVLIIQPT